MGASCSTSKAITPEKKPRVDTGNLLKNDDQGLRPSVYVIDESSAAPTQSVCDAPVFKKSDAVRELIRISLMKSFIFGNLTPRDLDNLIGVFYPLTCNKGEEIIKQGTDGDFMYVVESGQFEVLKDGEGKLSELGAGTAFGELALLYGARRSATVKCSLKASLWAIDRSTFKFFRSTRTSDQVNTSLAANVLSKVPILKDLSKEQISRVAEVARVEEHVEGSVVIRKGDIGSTFYIIIEGVVVCTDAAVGSDATGQAIKKGIRLKNGDFFGEIALLSDVPRTANVLADSPIRLLAFDRGAFESALGSLRDLLDKKGNVRLLDSVPFLARLAPQERSAAYDRFTTEHFSAGQIICRKGDSPVFYLVKSGKAVEELEGPVDPTKPPTEYQLGDHFNDANLLRNESVGATVRALNETTCFVLARLDFNRIMSDSAASSPGPSDKGSSTARAEIDWASLQNLGKIGAGTFGTVLMMIDTRNGETYAMKVLDRKRVKKMRQERRLETEKQLLLQMNSPFICRLFAETEDDSAFYLLMELVQGGELQRLIHRKDGGKQQKDIDSGICAGIPHSSAAFYTASISFPLVYLHRRSVAFRDLKPENVMIDQFGYPKLIDFGLAKPLQASNGKTFTLCGTPEYLAPEVILGTGHDQAVDWWALGVLCFEMVVGVSPFLEKGVDRRRQDHIVIFENIVDNRVTWPDDMEPLCRDLVRRLLNKKPLARMGCGRRAQAEFEEHGWFGALDWVSLARRESPPPWIPPLKSRTDQACFNAP